MTVSRVKLRDTVTCPHCWERWPATEVRFVSESPDFLGDPILGQDAHFRFLPSRYTLAGQALDPSGVVCRRMACPRCHGELPTEVLELPQTTLSIVGAPASGKSVMLAAATFGLRTGQVVPGLHFRDLDPTLNDLTIGMEAKLFKSGDPYKPAMISKTEVAGELYREYRAGFLRKVAPKPQLFSVSRGTMNSILALYDNAGEHFLPGARGIAEHATNHLAASQAIVFVVDPTQDVRVYEQLGGREETIGRGGLAGAGVRGDLILNELYGRIRRLRAMRGADRVSARLVIALSKADLWMSLAPKVAAEAAAEANSNGMRMPDGPAQDRIHWACKEFLESRLPELVGVAASFDADFRIVPFSGLGRAPQSTTPSAQLQIRPVDVKPLWAAVPMISALAGAHPEAFSEMGVSVG